MGDSKHRSLPVVGSPDAREEDEGPAAGTSLVELARLAAEGGPTNASRRAWMKLLGASMALAGLAGCTRMRGEKILPYTRSPKDMLPGVPRVYATSLVLDGFATGVLVESYDGRPIKIEGNPDHPASLGATTAFDQAAVLGVYDPDRARAMRAPGGAPATWERLAVRFAGARPDGGAGLRFLLEPNGSPLVGDLVNRVRARFPAARFTFHSPADAGHRAGGARLAFGAAAQPLYDFRRADVVLSLDDDFLGSGPFSVPYARAWAERRRPATPTASMSRLYVVETMPTPTGSVADHRLPRRTSEIAHTAARICAALASSGKRVPAEVATALGRLKPGADEPLLQAIARDLAAHAGASVVIVGARQPPIVHAMGHLMNAVLGNHDTAWTIDPTLVGAGDAEQDLATLAAEIDHGAVDTLVVLQDNAAYGAPVDLDFGACLAKVENIVYLGDYEDETAALAGWFVPAAHALESWGDARAYDGTVSLLQPLIAPLHGGRTVAELLALFAGEDDPDPRRMLQRSWGHHSTPDFDARWEEALRRGLVAGSAAPRRDRHLAVAPLAAAIAKMPAEPPAASGIEAAFALDPNVYDGRFTNNPWLLELPKPLTHLTWDNAVHLAAATAVRLGLADGDVVDLDLAGRTVRAPVFVVAGHAEDAATLHLGWGRRAAAESIGRDHGFDAYALRTTQAPWFAPGLAIRKRNGESYTFARTQLEMTTMNRPVALSATLAEYRKDPGFTAEQYGDQPTLLPPVNEAGDQWAMTIDMSICSGCSACVAACQAENNILVVGKEQVVRGREMHWLRIDTYLEGDPVNPRVVNQPMLCQHCERAPCEYVCPVNATVHSSDGLNEMVYNRCVGTRFCSNNCPYKVRRFNWFDWTEQGPGNQGSVILQRNPDVTVRQRGVMEKCTYCVQRIREVEIHARVEGQGRAIRPGEVVTACQEACPTGAIQFGSLRHRETKMVQWREEPRAFNVLHELGTRPRTVYLARIDNPNPEIK